MTRPEMETLVGQLLAEREQMRRLGLELGPGRLMLLKRLLYRLGWTGTKYERGASVSDRSDRINRAILRRLTRQGLSPSDPQLRRYTTIPPHESPLTPENQPPEGQTPHPSEQQEPVTAPAPEPPEWDGTIDDSQITETDPTYAENVAEFSRWSGGTRLSQIMHIEEAGFTPPGHTEPISVYRWNHVDHDGDVADVGEWTDDETEATQQAERHASRNDESPPDPDDSDIVDSDVSGQSWRNRDQITTFDEGGDTHDVRLEEGSFEFAGQDHNVYRWTTRNHDNGNWTLDRRQAIRDGEEFASNNHNPSSGNVHEYSYKPDYEPLGDKGAHYGVELETQLKDSSRLSIDEAAEQTLDTLNRGYGPEEFAYLKEDSSIESGSPHTGKGTFEIVTQPATLDVHREQWTPFFASVPTGLISHDANAGLHVHVGRDHLTELGIGKMVYFVNHPANKDFLTKLARRDSQKWAATYPGKKPHDLQVPTRRSALNLQPDKTIEFRLFRGTLKPESFFACLEFVDALVNLTRPGMAGVEDMANPNALIRYVVAFHKDYPHLLNFVEKYSGQQFVKRGPRKLSRYPQQGRIPVPMSASVRFFSNPRPRQMSRSVVQRRPHRLSRLPLGPARYGRVTLTPAVTHGQPFGGGSAIHHHEIRGDSGEKIGRLSVQPRNDGKHLFVHYVGPENVELGSTQNNYGPEIMHKVFSAAAEQYPHADFLSGVRMTGVRRGQRYVVDLNKYRDRLKRRLDLPEGPKPEGLGPNVERLSRKRVQVVGDETSRPFSQRGPGGVVRKVVRYETFEKRNKTAKNKAEAARRPHIKRGQHVCRGCWKHYHAIPRARKCPECGGDVYTVTKSSRVGPRRYTLDINETIRQGLHNSRERDIDHPTEQWYFGHDAGAGGVLADALDEAGQPHAPFFRNLIHESHYHVTPNSYIHQTPTGNYTQLLNNPHPLRDAAYDHQGVMWNFYPAQSSEGKPGVYASRTVRSQVGPQTRWTNTHKAILHAPALREWAAHPALPQPMRDTLNKMAEHLESRGNTEKLSRVRRYAMTNRSNFIDALRRIKSTNQKAVHEVAKLAARKLGLTDTKIVNALHDTPMGSVPGVAQAVYGEAPPDHLNALGAWLGLTGNLPGVTVFHARPTGPDALYRVRVHGSGMDSRARLDRFGITSRVLVPHRKGFDVIVPDIGNKLGEKVQAFADAHNSQVEMSPGHLSVIGSVDQARAREMFRNHVVKQEQGA